MKRKMAQFKVSAELIKQSLAMPDDAQIYNITRYEHSPNVFTFFVEHPDFKEIEESSSVPEISPIIEVNYEKRPSTWLTFNWGKFL